jgi:RNase P/RNase MRP subunit POP5
MNNPSRRLSPFRLFTFSPFAPPPHPAGLDGLIVLGARLNPQGKPGRVARMRLLHALKLWREHYPGSLLILTGGISGAVPLSEARAMAEWALEWAADNWGPDLKEELSPCLRLEEASGTTAASAANTLLLVKGLKLQRVGLVSDGLHLRRALFLFRRHFARHPIRLHPLAVPGVMRHYWRQGRYLWLGKMALREGAAWLKVLGTLTLGRGRPRR